MPFFGPRRTSEPTQHAATGSSVCADFIHPTEPSRQCQNVEADAAVHVSGEHHPRQGLAIISDREWKQVEEVEERERNLGGFGCTAGQEDHPACGARGVGRRKGAERSLGRHGKKIGDRKMEALRVCGQFSREKTQRGAKADRTPARPQRPGTAGRQPGRTTNKTAETRRAQRGKPATQSSSISRLSIVRTTTFAAACEQFRLLQCGEGSKDLVQIARFVPFVLRTTNH